MLEQDITKLKGVGPKVAESLAKLHIHTPLDLLFHLPSRYEDRTRLMPLGDLQAGQAALVCGSVISADVVYRGRRMLICKIADDTGELTLRFFQFHPNQLKQMVPGQRLVCFGDVRAVGFHFEIAHPEYKAIKDGEPVQLAESLDPIYPTTEGLGQATLRKIVNQALDGLATGAAQLQDIQHPLFLGLPALDQSLQLIHHPTPDITLASLQDGSHPAVQRLVAEELLAQQVQLQYNRTIREHQLAPPFRGSMLWERLLPALPFAPTNAQTRVIKEITDDLARRQPMLRLVQGDVGSGKTLVAAAAALSAIEAGYQAALMAPTEILAEQHHQNLSAWFKPLGITVSYLSGRLTPKARREALEKLGNEPGLLVGTHALFQQSVTMPQLGLAIIDEQHRFGVEQRLALKQKSDNWSAHQLILTATPIPRTLAMTVYSDLDLSVIDEMPPGRTPVTTVAIPDGKREAIIERVAKACEAGTQAYWVCPLVEESEMLQAENAEETHEALQAKLPQLKIGLIHGRLKGKEKADIMAKFKAHEIDVLVATTVIEVGVDVPNASLMIMENAERMGLSQLHQLRGRVGRGGTQSHCVLLYKSPLGEIAQQRLQVMRETNDGFVVAQKDLELRGPGEVFGSRQTGEVKLKVADLGRDHALIDKIQHTLQQGATMSKEDADVLVQRWIGSRQALAEA